MSSYKLQVVEYQQQTSSSLSIISTQTTNEPTVSPTTNEPTTGVPTIAVTDAVTSPPQVEAQAQQTTVVESGVSGSTITPPPTNNPTPPRE